MGVLPISEGNWETMIVSAMLVLAVLWQNVLLFALLSLLSGQMVGMHSLICVTNQGTSHGTGNTDVGSC